MIDVAGRIKSAYGQYLTDYLAASQAAAQLYNEFPNLPIFDQDPIGGIFRLPGEYLELLEPDGPTA